MTQVDLFALQTTAGSALDTHSLGVDSMNVRRWVRVIHRHHRLALITIGGVDDQHWDTACDNTYRGAFVANLISYMVSKGFDGIDIDIESNTWGARSAPVAAWDTCVDAIAHAAHATRTAAGARPIVSTDVDQTWMAPYVAGFASYPDQFNLMGYGRTCANHCSQITSDVHTMLTKGKVSSPAKLTFGMDVDQGDHGEAVSPAVCSDIAKYAQGARLGGVMIWTLQGDAAANHRRLPCLSAVAPYVAPAP